MAINFICTIYILASSFLSTWQYLYYSSMSSSNLLKNNLSWIVMINIAIKSKIVGLNSIWKCTPKDLQIYFILLKIPIVQAKSKF